MMPLLMARRGETNKISAVRGKDEIKRFLANLGFVEGLFLKLTVILSSM